MERPNYEDQSMESATQALMLQTSDLPSLNVTDLTEYGPVSWSDFTRNYCKLQLIYLNHVVTFSVFTFIGLIGNITLLSVILRTAGLRNAPNILLINVVVADLLYMVIATPFGILHELTPCWLYGSLGCKFRHYLPDVAQAVGILSLAALSRERYNAIVRGLQSRISRSTRRTMVVVASTWIVGLLVASPVFNLTRTSGYGILCQYLPMALVGSQVYMVLKFLFLYVIPLCYISINYVRLARSLCAPTMVDLAQNQSSANPIQARKRLAQIVLVITVLFGILWFPYYVYFLWFVFNNDNIVSSNQDKIRYFRHFYYYSSLANSCVNPFVVFTMSSAHRKSIVQCFQRSGKNPKGKRTLIVRHGGMSCRVSTSSYSVANSGTVVSKI
ncbi:bombesin receptor subtype-3-like [Amphiura filiformis]|uniref:bombesin receptor subtype-3-like n=1 Tax=Amphiura filiformis TaxID=82378 RepID=UPI003B21D956